MEVFVLLGGIDYEGHSLLGVYSSREAAEAARDVYDAEARFGYDWYDVVERVVDAAAETHFD